MKVCSVFVFLLLYTASFAQPAVTPVRDSRNMDTELLNTAARYSADRNMLRNLESINKSKERTLLNLTIVEQVQKRIYTSLTTVDKTLKQSKQIINAKNIVQDIIKYQSAVMEYAKDDPALLLFAEKQEKEFYIRGVLLLDYIRDFIMAEKEQLLMDVGKREKLISWVIDELRLMRAIAYTSQSQMYWARFDGVFHRLNPWQRFINQDKAKGQEILKNFKF